MNTTDDLKTAYPLLTSEGDMEWRLQQLTSNSKNVSKHTSKFDEDEIEIAYLKELELFMNETYTKEITKIKNKLLLIENSKKFDCSKIQYLPEDMIYEIKSYLEPEIKFTRKFSIIRELDMGFVALGWIEVDRWLANIPKKLLMNVITDCEVYPSQVKSKDLKEEWCKFIYTQIHNLFSLEKSAVRVDKLMEQHTYYNSGRCLILDRWFSIILHLQIYKKYRASLENKLKKTDIKLKLLKDTKIKCKNNI
jgi:hypothetical protein